MEQLGTIIRAVCMGVCACGIGIGVLGAIVLGIAGGGLISTIKEMLGIGERDEDELIDDTLNSIHQKRSSLQNRRSNIGGNDGIPDFDAAVAKYAGNNNPSDSGDNFSSQSLDEPNRPSSLGGLSNQSGGLGSGSLRRRNKRNDDYEIYDDGDFFGE